jgi:hypothetical protein
VTKIEKLIIGEKFYIFYIFNIKHNCPASIKNIQRLGPSILPSCILLFQVPYTKPVFILPLIPGKVAEDLLGFTLSEAEAHPGRFAAWRAYCEHAVGDFGVRVCVSPDGAVREYHVIATEVRPLPLTCVSRDSASD